MIEMNEKSMHRIYRGDPKDFLAAEHTKAHKPPACLFDAPKSKRRQLLHVGIGRTLDPVMSADGNLWQCELKTEGRLGDNEGNGGKK